VKLPKNQNIVGCNWIFKKKRDNTKCGEGKIQDMIDDNKFSTNQED